MRLGHPVTSMAQKLGDLNEKVPMIWSFWSTRLGQSGSIGNHDNTLLYSLPDILRLYNKIKVF